MKHLNSKTFIFFILLSLLSLFFTEPAGAEATCRKLYEPCKPGFQCCSGTYCSPPGAAWSYGKWVGVCLENESSRMKPKPKPKSAPTPEPEADPKPKLRPRRSCRGSGFYCRTNADCCFSKCRTGIFTQKARMCA